MILRIIYKDKDLRAVYGLQDVRLYDGIILFYSFTDPDVTNRVFTKTVERAEVLDEQTFSLIMQRIYERKNNATSV